VANVRDIPSLASPYSSNPVTEEFAMKQVQNLYHYYKIHDKHAKLKAINNVIAIIKRGEFAHYFNIAKSISIIIM
jgi:hypothetical protein